MHLLGGSGEAGGLSTQTPEIVLHPRILGIGIDESTALVRDARHCFTVLGAGAVHVPDGRPRSYTSLCDETRDRTLPAFDVRLHVLRTGDEFDIETRRPATHPADAVERALVGAH